LERSAARHDHVSCSSIASLPRCVMRYWTDSVPIGRATTRPPFAKRSRVTRCLIREQCDQDHRHPLAASKVLDLRALEPNCTPDRGLQDKFGGLTLIAQRPRLARGAKRFRGGSASRWRAVGLTPISNGGCAAPANRRPFILLFRPNAERETNKSASQC
jgi:hypothetical protein